jgi:hypothetical protein
MAAVVTPIHPGRIRIGPISPNTPEAGVVSTPVKAYTIPNNKKEVPWAPAGPKGNGYIPNDEYSPVKPVKLEGVVAEARKYIENDPNSAALRTPVREGALGRHIGPAGLLPNELELPEPPQIQRKTKSRLFPNKSRLFPNKGGRRGKKSHKKSHKKRHVTRRVRFDRI